MKVKLYWRLSDRRYFFDFDEWSTGGPDGVEYEGEYEITLDGATLTKNVLGDKMIKYKGELYDLHTSQKRVLPFIWYTPKASQAVPLFFKVQEETPQL